MWLKGKGAYRPGGKLTAIQDPGSEGLGEARDASDTLDGRQTPWARVPALPSALNKSLLCFSGPFINSQNLP